MSDIEFEEFRYIITGSESGNTSVATFTDGKAAFIRVSRGLNGVDETHFAQSFAFVDLTRDIGSSYRYDTTGGSLTNVSANNNPQTIIYDQTTTAEEVRIRYSMTSTELTAEFLASDADCTMDILVFKGPASVEATVWETNGNASPLTGLPAEPNVLICVCPWVGVVGGTSGSGSHTFFHTGFACNNDSTIEQGGMEGRISGNRSKITSDMISSTGGGPNLEITGFTSDGFTHNGSTHYMYGIALTTGGSASIKEHFKDDTVLTNDTQSMPDAGFDDVGMMMMLCAATDVVDTAATTYSNSSVGIAVEGEQKTMFAHRTSSTVRSRPQDGRLIIGEDDSGNTFEGSIDDVGRIPTITWNDADAIDVRALVLYVEQASTTTPITGYNPMLVSG